MQKSDLKTGMVVVLANGHRYVVLKIGDLSYLEDTMNCLHLGYWDENLLRTNKIDYKYDIMEVHKFSSYSGFNYLLHVNDLIWKREEATEMTIAEIENILGKRIKIVKETK